MVVKRRGQNEHLKQGERTKTNLYSIISKLTLIHENITNSTNILIVCIYICVSSCVYVCVCVTQLNYKKNCKIKMSFFYD